MRSLPRPVRRLPMSARPVRGIALIEALVAILIFSLAILGLVGLQVSTSKAQTGAKFRADAANYANDLVGTIWADAANRSQYDSANCDSYAKCKDWKTRTQAALPGSSDTAMLDVGYDDKTDEFTITIGWKVPGEGAHQYVTTTTIVPNE